MIYNNELMHVSLAVNQGSFIDDYKVEAGDDGTVEFTKKEDK